MKQPRPTLDADPTLDAERSRYYENLAATLAEEEREREESSTDTRTSEEVRVDAFMAKWEYGWMTPPYGLEDPFPAHDPHYRSEQEEFEDRERELQEYEQLRRSYWAGEW